MSSLCDYKTSLVCIQIIHVYFLPPHDCERSWWGWWLGITSGWRQLVYFIDQNSPSSYSYKPYFFIVDFCLFHLMDQRSLILNIVLRCYRRLSVGCIQIGHTDFVPPQVCVYSWWEWRLCDCTCHNQFIDCIKVDHPKLFLLIFIYIIFSSIIRRRLHIYWFINIIGGSSFCESLKLF